MVRGAIRERSRAWERGGGGAASWTGVDRGLDRLEVLPGPDRMAGAWARGAGRI